MAAKNVYAESIQVKPIKTLKAIKLPRAIHLLDHGQWWSNSSIQ